MQKMKGILECCSLLVLFAGALTSSGDEISLVRVGDVWNYYCGINAPSSPIGAWQQDAFDDSFWLQDQSGFSTVTAEPYREASPWPVNCPSIFLRCKFIVSDAASVKWLVLRMDYESGFVAYLNGQEIARRGLTNTPVVFNDYADYHPGGIAEEFDVSAAAGALLTGENVLAIEVHTAVTNESGPAFTNHMMLVPELLANFQRGPFLQNATTNSIQVIWRTPIPADTVVDFGTNQTLGAEVSEATLTTNHVATLTNLLPGTRYFYQVRSTADAVSAESPTNSFSTLKTSGDVSFLVFADSGDGSAAQHNLAGAMEQAGADLVIHCGDVMEEVFYPVGQEDLRCLSVYGHMMRSVPFFFAMGDHDVGNDAGGVDNEDVDWYLSTFYLPTNSVFGTEHFYSFDHGNVHFVVLYVPPLVAETNELATYEMYDGSAQYCWLTNDLAASSKPWKLVFLFHPLDTSGNHRFDNFNADNPHFGTTNYDWQVMQNLLLPVAQRYGVQMVFSGHSHDYERFMPINGVHFSVNGCGGRVDTPMEQRDTFSSQFYSGGNLSRFTKVTIHGDSLFLQGILADGTVFDYMTLQRALPPAQAYDATWNTPLVEDSPANNGYGNIAGQTFYLVGTPIPALAGYSANLGRVYVNNDATNLFIGFEQSMFPSNSTVFLFIESPRQNGVTNLIGLGDGIAGSAEGVDGLDFLENLSFTNFTPSVACLLGDENADAQSRNFIRPGSAFAFGQGVFRLDAGFTDVAGVRLQQFNRSPQSYYTFTNLHVTNTYSDGNADFMEVAIPLEQLGGLRPGDTIKIAAVVGLCGCDTNAQTRELDTGFLGSSMVGSGQSNVVLGAICVRLAPKDLTVKANDITRAYGATNPILTITYDGFVNGDYVSVLSGSPVITTVADTNSPVGVYPIELNLGTLTNAHYHFIGAQGTLTITPALLTVTANDQARSYGTTNPPLTATYSGFVNGEDTNILSGAPALFTTAGTNSPVGTYSIISDGGTLALAYTNYAFAFSNGILTVTSAILTVTADDQARSYGATNPPLTATYSGFVNGEDANILSGVPVLFTTAGTNSPVGVYPIQSSAGTLSNANYSLFCTNGSLTVTQAVLTVTADDQTRGYGAMNPPLTATCHGFVNGQDTNILTGSPVLVTTAETNSPVGGYPITPSLGTLGLTDTNYVFVFYDGALTILAANSTSTLLSSQNPSTNGFNVIFTATVSPVLPAVTTPTGSVAFLTNSVLQGMVGLSNGVAWMNLACLSLGTNEVEAAYSGDENYLGSTNRLQQVILQAPIPCADVSFILSVVKSGTNTFAITLMGTTNAQYCMLESINVSVPMTDWIVLPDSTNSATNGVWYYTITNVGAFGNDSTNLAGKFFRARAVNPCP